MPTREQIQALMERTGCGYGEAERALDGSQGDLDQATQAVGSSRKHIALFKGKFLVEEPQLFGLWLTASDLASQGIIRLRGNLSYNPEMFEVSLGSEWYLFERALYAYRLREGALQTQTQELERFLYTRLAGRDHGEVHPVLQGAGDAIQAGWRDLLTEFFRTATVKVQVVGEALNLAQYQGIANRSSEANPQVAPSVLNLFGAVSRGDSLLLQVRLAEDPAGRFAGDLGVGELVHSHIVDHRDIGQYLAQLLGGKSGQCSVPLASPVEEVQTAAGETTVRVRLAPGILGQATLPTRHHVKVSRSRNLPWWKRWLAWKGRQLALKD